jgi:CHAT domain-containing protein/tetratricopeptide (TPR) repeat protein
MLRAARWASILVAMACVGVPVGPVYAQPIEPVDALRQLIREARFPEAEAGARRLLAETEATTGRESAETAQVLELLVEALRRGGRARSPEAKALAERALAINEARFGAADPVVARTLDVAAALAGDTGELSGASTLYERALAIRRRVLPEGDPAIAESLNGLGVILERQGDNAGAERHHTQALAIREQALGPAHPDVAISLNNLGNVQNNLGNYAQARALHERALAIRERALGVDHPDVAASLNNLAVDVRDLGDHAAAWQLLERVLGIYERTLGPDHPNVGFVCHNLATILLDLGDTAGERLLADGAKRSQPPDPYAAARALFERALRIKETALGPRHTSVAVTLTSLANVLSHLKQWDEAEPLYERALAIREEALGPSHPDVAETLDRLGEFLVEKADYPAARPVFERVLAILKQTYGPDHPRVGAVRQHLAEVLAAKGESAGALQMALETERIGRDHLRTIGRTLPEREALMYATGRPVGLDVALTLIARGENGTRASSAAVWDAVVRSRAVVLDEMAYRHRVVRAAGEPDLARLVDDLTSKRDQLARLVVRGPGASQEQYRTEIARAREARDAAERAVAERSVVVRREQFQRHIGLDEVRAALPRQSALVAFVRYKQLPLRPRTAHEGRARPAIAYLAFLVSAADPSSPVAVPLGAAAPIDDAIAHWRKQIRAVAFAGGRSTVRAEAAVRRAGARLRASIWDPLAPHLVDATRIFIVPDGPLHLVSWDALPAAGRAYLVERAPPFHYASAERDLVKDEPRVAGQGLLVVDSPVFDQPSGRAALLRGADCAGFRSMRFDPLPASRREAETITGIWRKAGAAVAAADISRLSGRAATEAEVKRRAQGARVLHIATHGFFVGGQCAVTSARSADTRLQDPEGEAAVAENPLLMAGFALTGANRRHVVRPDEEDGILTAEEIASLQLSGVEWAVLSACDTGVGEVRAGEGVFGLRRAFHVAGARTVIMSLWPVEDEDALRWMASMYERRFHRGASAMEAMRDSSLEQLRRRRRAGLSTHPFYWAAFIAAGDWR